MTDWRKIYDEGCCLDGYGCSVCRTCMCALAEDVIDLNEELVTSLEGMLMEWDKLSRYGSPIAKAANERVNAARAVVAKAKESNHDTSLE